MSFTGIAFNLISLPVFIGILGAVLIFITCLPAVDSLRIRLIRLAWRARLKGKMASPHGSWKTAASILAATLTNKLNISPEKGWARTVLEWWRDSGAEGGLLSFFASLFTVIMAGIVFSRYLFESLLLQAFTLVLLLIGFLSWICLRVRYQRQMFQNQFPDVLERLADSLLAGFSLTQAIEFIVPNLAQPSSDEMASIALQIRLGFTPDQALRELYHRHPTEDVRIFVEGLTLQRQVGGNTAAMIFEMAGIVRSRVELQNEVRTLTAQGRLSAVVLALLVPISLGLLSFFPGYTEVLYKTTIGNLVLVTAGILELLGAFLVARLVEVKE